MLFSWLLGSPCTLVFSGMIPKQLTIADQVSSLDTRLQMMDARLQQARTAVTHSQIRDKSPAYTIGLHILMVQVIGLTLPTEGPTHLVNKD